jgi:hypothetical protein
MKNSPEHVETGPNKWLQYVNCARTVNTGGVVGTKHDSIERIHEGVLGQFFECVMIFFFD